MMEDVVFVTMKLSYLFGEAVFEIFDADGALFGQTTVNFLKDVKRQLLLVFCDLFFINFFKLIFLVLLVPLPDKTWN